MSILFPYPVVDLDPSLQKVHTNYETIHWKGLAGQTAVGAMSGYFFYWLKASNQVTKKVPRYHVFGALAGMCLGTYNNHYTITNQFQGYFPNENLIKKYGSLSDDQIVEALKKEGASTKPINPFSLPPVLAPDEFTTSKEKQTVPNRYPMVSLFPSSNTIILNFEQWDYVRMFGCGLAFFINAILITKFIRGHQYKVTIDSVSRETINSFFFFQGILMGMVTEYNTSHLRLIGLAPNELEVQKYGKLDEKKLMKEILMNKFPVVNFDEVNLEEVLFNEETLKLIELALQTKYPYTDLSNIVFENLSKHSSNQNQTVIELITKAGYPTPTYF